VIGRLVVLVRVSFGFVVCGVVIAALLIPVTAGLVQENVAPEAALAGVYEKVDPEHIE
jgi:hypothetical protein